MSPGLFRPSALLLAAGLAGCGTVTWHKDGTGVAAIDEDLRGCQREAQGQMARLYGPPLPVQGSPIDPRFGPDTLRPSPADRLLQEQQVVERCMRERGYTLVPVTPSP